MKKRLFSWLAMFCFIVPCVFGLSACTKNDPTLTGYKVIVNQQLIAESREISVTYGDEIEWSAIAMYDDNSTTAITSTDVTVVDEDTVVGTTPTVGEYQIKFKYSSFDEYVVTLNITPKLLAVPTVTNLVYSGEEQATEIVGFDTNTMTMSGDLLATTAGTYSVEVALKDTTNYRWANGSTESQTVEYIVSKAKVAKPTKVEKTYVYNGSPQTLELNGYDASYMSITGNTETNAGTYTAVITLADTTNYEWKNAVDSNIEWSIAKAQGTAPATAPTALSGTYDSAKTLADYTLDAGFTWVNPTTVPEVAQTEYDVIYNPDSQNYTDYEMTITLSLTRARVAVPLVDTTEELAYDGSSKTVVLASFIDDIMTVGGNSAIEVGEHTAVVTITNNNYEYTDGTTSVELEWTIAKGIPTITIPYNFSKQYDGTEVNLPRYEVPGVLAEELSVIGDGVTVVYKNSAGETIDRMDTYLPGEYSMRITTAETTHYKSASASTTFKVYTYLPSAYNADTLDFELSSYDIVYTGAAQTPEVSIIDKNINTGTEEAPVYYTLQKSTDYTLEYKDNINYYGKPYFEVTGKGAYEGTIRYYFDIYTGEMFESVTVNTNAVSNGSVSTTSNQAGHTVTLTLSDLYEDALTYGHFNYYVEDKFNKCIVPITTLADDTLTFVIPNESKSVSIEYDCDNGLSKSVINFVITLSDAVDNRDYLQISTEDCQTNKDNIILIYENATDTTTATRALISNIFANSDTKITFETGYSYVADSLTFADDDSSLTVQVTNGTETVTLSYDIKDARPDFYKGYVDFYYVLLYGPNSYEYVTLPANKTLTIEKMNDGVYVDYYANSSGNIQKVEYLFDGKVLHTIYDTHESATQGVSSVRFGMVVENDDYTETAIVDSAGTYTLRFYLTETTYEDYFVVIEEIIETKYVEVVYDGNTYSLNQNFDGGISAQPDWSTGNVECLYMYAGRINASAQTITVALDSTMTNFYDEDKQLIADPSNVTLSVLTNIEEGFSYSIFYCIMNNGEFTPVYIYFKDAPEGDILFHFENTSLTFNFEYEEEIDGTYTEYRFGDFVATSIIPDDYGMIYLDAMVSAEDIGLLTGTYVDDTYGLMPTYDKTALCNIELNSMYGMVFYNNTYGYVATQMYAYPEDVHIGLTEAIGQDDTSYLMMFTIADLTNPMVMYCISIIVV